jgi:hypothetical protein
VSRVGTDTKQDLRIGFRKAGGRFVKDQQTRLTNQAFANLDQLLLPDGHVAHDDVWVEMQVSFLRISVAFSLSLFRSTKARAVLGSIPRKMFSATRG